VALIRCDLKEHAVVKARLSRLACSLAALAALAAALGAGYKWH
jgi:hypothetical protein